MEVFGFPPPELSGSCLCQLPIAMNAVKNKKATWKTSLLCSVFGDNLVCKNNLEREWTEQDYAVRFDFGPSQTRSVPMIDQKGEK